MVDHIWHTLNQWRADGKRCALARVVRTEKSAPLPPGTAMAVADTGEVVGGVSGGCVDGAVYTMCEQVLADGTPVTVEYGMEADGEFDVGPTCGGSLEVFIECIEPLRDDVPDLFEDLATFVQAGTPVVLATTITGSHAGASMLIARDGAIGSLGNQTTDQSIRELAADLLGATNARVVTAAGEPPVFSGSSTDRTFLQSIAPPRLLVFGASAFGEALTRVGDLLGYRVTVCDARPAFARPERFPTAHEVVVRWPHEYLRETAVDSTTAICVLTHDHKFDIPLLCEALRTDAGYIGAMGSRRAHAERVERLRDEGLTESELKRLSSPIGLDLGARTAEETAVSIAAELVAHLRGGTGTPLTGLDVAIHR